MNLIKKLFKNIAFLVIFFSLICIISKMYIITNESSLFSSQYRIRARNCLLLIQKSNSSAEFSDPKFSSYYEFIENEITFEVIYKDENGVSPIKGVFLRLNAPFSLDKNLKIELKTKDNQSDSELIKKSGLKFISKPLKLDNEGQWKYYLQAFGENNTLLKETKQQFGPYIFGYNEIMRILTIVLIILTFSASLILCYIEIKKKKKELEIKSKNISEVISIFLILIFYLFLNSELFIQRNPIPYLIWALCFFILFILTTIIIYKELRAFKLTEDNSEVHENADEEIS